jgi:asparagine synthetase B (glutamine-hydrolysing)
MCGITGILLALHAADPDRLTEIEIMTATLHLRRPDRYCIWVAQARAAES